MSCRLRGLERGPTPFLFISGSPPGQIRTFHARFPDILKNKPPAPCASWLRLAQPMRKGVPPRRCDVVGYRSGYCILSCPDCSLLLSCSSAFPLGPPPHHKSGLSRCFTDIAENIGLFQVILDCHSFCVLRRSDRISYPPPF